MKKYVIIFFLLSIFLCGCTSNVSDVTYTSFENNIATFKKADGTVLKFYVVDKSLLELMVIGQKYYVYYTIQHRTYKDYTMINFAPDTN